MKYFLFVLMLIFCACPNVRPSYAESSYYAQIINPDTFLYRDLKSSVIFELPESYFVKISGYQKGYYTAEYDGIKGFVKASDIKVIRGVPEKPYLKDATFRLYSSDYNKLKLTPHLLSETLATLPINVKINYIAKTYSQEVVEDRGNIWYYCSYKDNDEVLFGYVYAGMCDKLSITPNTENFDYMPNPFISESTEYIEYLNGDGRLMVIAPAIILSIFFIPLLFLPKFVKNYKKKQKQMIIEDGKI